ncbi:hypothetical protein B0H19DRAFT_1272206 [Mycena capillaripes]|nr:hypothetical protein B0H19DRAFT_1272206 [Mycena capillaripes]
MSRTSSPPRESDSLVKIKVKSEEWHRLTLSVNPRPNVELPAVDLHPCMRFGEPIPVHVQLTGAVRALRKFLSDPASAAPRSLIEVTLPCVLLPTPPSTCADSDHEGANLDRAGELRVNADVAAVRSFDTAVLQHFIVINVREPARPKSQFAHTRHSRTIRLVTESSAFSPVPRTLRSVKILAKSLLPPTTMSFDWAGKTEVETFSYPSGPHAITWERE